MLALGSKALLSKLSVAGVVLDGGLGVYELTQGNEKRGAWLIGGGALAAFALFPGVGWLAGAVLIGGSIACAIVADYHRTTPFQKRLAEILNRTQFADPHFEKIAKPAIELHNQITEKSLTRLLEYTGSYSMTYSDGSIGSISSITDAMEDIFQEIRQEYWTLDTAWFPVEYFNCPPPTDPFQIPSLDTAVCLANPTPQELCRRGASQLLFCHRALRIGYRLPATGLVEEYLEFSLPEGFGLRSLGITLNCHVDDATRRCTCDVEVEVPGVAAAVQATPDMKSIPDCIVGEINELRALVMVIRPSELETAWRGELKGKAGEILHLIIVCVNYASPHDVYRQRLPEIAQVRATVISSVNPGSEVHLSGTASQHATTVKVQKLEDPDFLGTIEWPAQ